jgi:hypothetical protein
MSTIREVIFMQRKPWKVSTRRTGKMIRYILMLILLVGCEDQDSTIITLNEWNIMNNYLLELEYQGAFIK